MFGMTLSKGSPLPFEQKELGPDGRPIIGLFYFKLQIVTSGKLRSIPPANTPSCNFVSNILFCF